MNEEPAIAKVERPRWFSWWMILGLSWLASILAMALAVGRHATLDPVSLSFVEVCATFGLFLGTALFVFPVGPIQVLVLLIIRLTKARGQIANFMMILPVLTIAVLGPIASIGENRGSHQPTSFKNITGMAYPEGAKLLKWGHGFGLQDKRHLWVFEGTPGQFETFKTAAAWSDDAGPKMSPLNGETLKQVDRAFSPGGPWTIAEVYMWMADKDATSGPNGPGWLLVDKDHKRWCVWWDAI